jgi:phosphoribosyl-AMP cyclohydrolase
VTGNGEAAAEEPVTVDREGAPEEPVTGLGVQAPGDPALAGAPEAAEQAPTGTLPEPPGEALTIDQLRFNGDGLICAVAQQFDTREVLMVAWMDAEAVRRTLATGAATYFSRSRRQYWVKGETSGHTQKVVEVRYDCDADALLLLVDQTGPACHTGSRSCFENRVLPLEVAVDA